MIVCGCCCQKNKQLRNVRTFIYFSMPIRNERRQLMIFTRIYYVTYDSLTLVIAKNLYIIHTRHVFPTCLCVRVRVRVFRNWIQNYLARVEFVACVIESYHMCRDIKRPSKEYFRCCFSKDYRQIAQVLELFFSCSLSLSLADNREESTITRKAIDRFAICCSRC